MIQSHSLIYLPFSFPYLDDHFNPKAILNDLLGNNVFPALKGVFTGTSSNVGVDLTFLKPNWFPLPFYIPSDNSCAGVGEV